MADANIWAIRGGRAGDADALFLKKNVVAVGWGAAGDPGKLEPTREAFKAAVAKAWPAKTPGSVANGAGQLFRFVREMQVGDLVIYPSKMDRQVHIGRVDGPYRYDLTLQADWPNVRPVKWLASAPRTRFSQGALYEIGSALSLFMVKNYADEFRAVVDGTGVAQPVRAKDDETVAGVSKDVEETTRDFVLKTLAQETKGHPFAYFVAHLLNVMGYRTRVSPEGPDGGIDIIAHRDELGFEPPIIKVQVKSTEGKVGDPETSALYGKVGSGEHGLLVTLGYFSSQARSFERSKANLRLIDGEQLVELVIDHYEKFDGKYKAMLPLRRVYVPELAETGD